MYIVYSPYFIESKHVRFKYVTNLLHKALSHNIVVTYISRIHTFGIKYIRHICRFSIGTHNMVLALLHYTYINITCRLIPTYYIQFTRFFRRSHIMCIYRTIELLCALLAFFSTLRLNWHVLYIYTVIPSAYISFREHDFIRIFERNYATIPVHIHF